MIASTYLFVYGSLRKGFQHPAYEYLTSFFHFVCESKAQGYLYKSEHYPVAAPTTENNFIIGELYKLNDDAEYSWAMAQLDDYEGLNVMQGETPAYRRELTNAYIGDTPQLAWVYWYNNPVDNLEIIPENDVITYLSQTNPS